MSKQSNNEAAAPVAETPKTQAAWRVRPGATLTDPKSGATIAFSGELLPIDHPIARANSADVYRCEVPEGALPELISKQAPAKRVEKPVDQMVEVNHDGTPYVPPQTEEAPAPASEPEPQSDFTVDPPAENGAFS